MNQFEYVLKMDDISKMKTLKAKEALLRELYNSDNNCILEDGWRSTSKEKDALQQINQYKCYMRALKAYSGSHLPLFLKDAARNATTTMFNAAVAKHISYAQYCDIFQYTEQISMVTKYYSIFLADLARLIGDNPNPVHINYSWQVSSNFSQTTSINDIGISLNMDEIFEVEDVKRQLDPSITYTVIEDILSSLHHISRVRGKLEYIIKLEQRMNDWAINVQNIKESIIGNVYTNVQPSAERNTVTYHSEQL